jgi:integrase
VEAEDRVFRRLGLRFRIRRNALHTLEHAHNHLSPAAVKAGLGPIGWHTLRHTYRAWLGDNGEPLTVQKEFMRHASIQTTLNTYGGGMIYSMREAHRRVVKQAIAR